MAKNPSHKEAQAALDKHLRTTNALNDAEKEKNWKRSEIWPKLWGESYSSTKALLAVREKTRSLGKRNEDPS